MTSLDRVHHRLSLVAAAVLTVTVIVLTLVLGGTDDAAGRGDPVPPVGDGEGDVTLTSIGDFPSPVNVAFAPGQPGTVYVVEQHGIVEAAVGDSATTFLDVTNQTNESGEQGLLGLAFHPNFASNDRVYAYYTDEDNGDIVVSEFEASDPLNADESTRRQVIRIRHRFAGNHNGGQLQFGPDGHLYLATGDGGSGGDPRELAQDKGSLLGKMLRINPSDPPGARDYRIPSGNPFKGKRGKDEILAVGLRNPFRFTFDQDTGRISIGDVGQDRFEEVDYETPSGLRNANFGWDRFEGFRRYAGGDTARTPKAKRHDKPIFAYRQSSGGCAVTGGVVVRDASLLNLYGRYLFADFCGGRLRSFIPKLGGAEDVKYLDMDEVGAPTSFASDPVTNDVYMTTLENPGDPAPVYRLDP
jgi:glucose/arabinose dehydrogenase